MVRLTTSRLLKIYPLVEANANFLAHVQSAQTRLAFSVLKTQIFVSDIR